LVACATEACPAQLIEVAQPRGKRRNKDRAPAARHDKRGLAISLTGGARVVAIDSEGADIETRSGWRQRFYRNKR